MERAILFEQYDPQKFENQLKNFNQLNDADKQKLLIDAFINPTAYFLTPIQSDGRSLRMMQTSDGKLILPIFTSVKKAMKDPTFDVNAKMYRGNIAYYGSLVEKEANVIGIVLNYLPGQPGIVISRESILQMRSTYLKRVEALKNTQGQAALRSISFTLLSASEKETILGATRHILSGMPEISSCWLRRASCPDPDGTANTQIVYVVETENGAADAVAELKQKLEEALQENETVAIFTSVSTVGEKLAKGFAPDYKRA